MVHDLSDHSWVKAFYDSATEWWGESWYDFVILKAQENG